MARPNQEAIDTFISITGVAEPVAVQKLEEHRGDLNAAVNAHFSEGDRSSARGNVVATSVAASEDDLMEIDDPVEVAPRRDPPSLLSEATTVNPFSIPDPQFRRSLFDGGSHFMDRSPFVTRPRELREIPIEAKDGGNPSSHSGHGPVIEDVTGTEQSHGPDVRGTVIIDDDDDDGDDIQSNPTEQTAQKNEQQGDISGHISRARDVRPSAPQFNDLPAYSNDIEEEMVRAAIEASKQDAQELIDPGPWNQQSPLEDDELAHVVSLSLKTVEQEKTLHEQSERVGASEAGASVPAKVAPGNTLGSNGRMETGSSSLHDEVEDLEEQPLIRHRSRHTNSGSMEPSREAGVTEASAASSPVQNNPGTHQLHNGNAFPSDEWGGISSEEHDEAVMLEAAMFGGIPEVTGYRFPYAPHSFTESSYPQRIPRPPSPSLQAQRLIREQQDDEYLASLAADREKELKALEEAEARRQEEMQKEEETRRKLEEEQELERQLAAKEASLPQEPEANDENAVTLLVRMPDGTRRGRRFLKSDSLQYLFDFIDIGRLIKPGTYRLVRPYPRRAFSNGESTLTLSELGLTSKQEALFLELV